MCTQNIESISRKVKFRFCCANFEPQNSNTVIYPAGLISWIGQEAMLPALNTR